MAIFDKGGRPIADVLHEAALQVAEQRNRHRPADYVVDPNTGRRRLVAGHRAGKGFLERQAAKVAS